MSQITRAAQGPEESAAPAGPFARLVVFLRQVVAEMRKVVYPSRQQVLTYTVVVLVFVLVIMAYVSVLDYGFGRLVLWAFGG